MNWVEADPLEWASDVARVGATAHSAEPNSDVTLENDLAWILGHALLPNRRCRLFVLQENGHALAYAALLEHPSAFEYQLGELTLFTYRISRLTLFGGVRFSEVVDAARHPELLEGLLLHLRNALGPRRVLFLLGIGVNGTLARSIRDNVALRARYRVLPHGPRYQRRLVRLPASFDAYLSELGSKTRQDLSRNERRLVKQTGNSLALECYTRAEEAHAFLEKAEAISIKTYQWRLLGMRVRNEPGRLQRLQRAAELGWLRCYVLRTADAPLAFMIGYIYDGTYYSAEIGYDPDWDRYSPGNVLHSFVMRDLMSNVPDARYFDFMYGDNSNKARLSNAYRTEASYYLIPRTPRWFCLITLQRIVSGISQSVGALLERFGLKRRIKRFIRRAATG